jgi:murein DD-endopeptidase MepM/ murein hydrolase activator NlpD
VSDGSSVPSDQAVGEAPALVASSPALAPAPIRPKVGVGQYTVVRGDTMFSIARRAELSLQALSAANGIVDPSAVKAGRVLYVPSVPGSVHVVAKDESLESIIRKYDVKADSVREANGLDKQPELTAGQLLVIPGVMRATASEIRPMPSTMNASVLPAAGEAAPTSKSTQPPPTANSRPTISAETGTMIWPIIGQISTPYGPTHRGLDVVAKQGTPIKAALAGKVIAAQEWDGPYGWYVIVQHGADFTTVYSHLSKIRVKEGDTVAQGHVVGDVGTTGQSTGPHLHFELRKSNLPLDPRPYLP